MPVFTSVQSIINVLFGYLTPKYSGFVSRTESLGGTNTNLESFTLRQSIVVWNTIEAVDFVMPKSAAKAVNDTAYFNFVKKNKSLSSLVISEDR